MLKKWFGKETEIIFEVKPETQEEPGQYFPSRFPGGPNEYYSSDRHHSAVEVTAHDTSSGKRRTERVVDETYGDPKKAKAKAEKAARKLAVRAGRNGSNVILHVERVEQEPLIEWPSLEPSQSDVNKDVLLFAGVFGIACIVISGLVYALAALQGYMG